jgi:hypothetical protein
MKLLVIVLSVLLLSLTPAPQRAEPADIVFKSGNVYTANDKAARAQAVAVKADRIIFVGTNAAAQKFVGPNTRVVDLKGKLPPGAYRVLLAVALNGNSTNPEVKVISYRVAE